MNTYIFSPEAKRFCIKGIIAGLIIFLVGVGINWNFGKDNGHHVAEAGTHTEHLLAEANSHSDVHYEGDESVAKEIQSDPTHHTATLKTLVISNVYIIVQYAYWIGLAALFFLSATTLALGGWHIQVQKSILAIAGTLPYSIATLILFFALFSHDLFHWTDSSLYVQGGPNFDLALFTKHDYLNLTRFWIFAILMFGISLAINYYWNKNLKEMDENPSVKLFDNSRKIAAVSIVLIAMVINPFGSWDWAMSIQPHWFSTMFSWNLFASASVAMFAITVLIVLYLKKADYLQKVNANHFHNIGLYMFAITIFWAYTWFSQYMLIWYANIPEETIYFSKRMNGYAELFYLSLIFNFAIPFLVLMTRDSKRRVGPLLGMGVLLIIGHYIDFFNMMVPELVPHGGFGLVGIGALVFIASIFGYITLNTLSKYKDLESSTHPYIKESYEHQI